MLPKSRRLSRINFLDLKASSQSRSFPHFTLVVRSPSPPPSLSRFSVVTSAKLHKKAVVRNRLRRRLYDQLSALNFPRSLDIIVIPRPSMLNLSHEEIASELHQALSSLTSS